MILGGLAYGQAADPNRGFAELDWTGYKKIGQLKTRAPEAGYIGSEEAWFKMWKAWRVDEVPLVDFAKHVVLVITADGKNATRLAMEFDQATGDLHYRISSTRVKSAGFSYGMKLVDRVATTSLNGIEIPAYDFGGVRRLDIPSEDFSYRSMRSFAIRSKAERDLYITLTQGAWGRSSEVIRKALRTRPIDFEKEMAIFVFHPQKIRSADPVVFGKPMFEETRVIVPVTALSDDSEANSSAGIGYLIQKSNKRLFYKVNDTLRIIATLEGDVGLKTFSNVRRYRLLLQSRSAEERIFAGRALQRLGSRANEAIPELVACLRHENLDVQTQAALALRSMGSYLSRSEGQLRAVLADPATPESGRSWGKLVLETLVSLPDYKPPAPGSLRVASPGPAAARQAAVSRSAAPVKAVRSASALPPPVAMPHAHGAVSAGENVRHAHQSPNHVHAGVGHSHTGPVPQGAHRHPVPKHVHPGGPRGGADVPPPLAVPHVHTAANASTIGVPHVHFAVPHTHAGAPHEHRTTQQGSHSHAIPDHKHPELPLYFAP